jgi:hypothetical protein
VSADDGVNDEKGNIEVRKNPRKTTHNLKNGVFWDVMPCGSCKNRRFGGTYKSHTALTFLKTPFFIVTAV